MYVLVTPMCLNTEALALGQVGLIHKFVVQKSPYKFECDTPLHLFSTPLTQDSSPHSTAFNTIFLPRPELKENRQNSPKLSTRQTS